MSTSYEHSAEVYPHDHHHDHFEHEPVISKRWKWAAALGNIAVSVFEGWGGGASGALQSAGAGSTALAADALHNVGDGAGYFIQAETVLRRQKLSAETLLKRRKMSHTIICLGSLAIASKAGLDVAFDHELSSNPLSIYAASASLALNSLLAGNLYRNIRRRNQHALHSQMTESEKDLMKHMALVDMPSAVLAVGGVLGQRYGINMDTTLAMLSGAFGAWVFRPTIGNLVHDHTHEQAPLNSLPSPDTVPISDSSSAVP